ncbi:uncharacterized protein LOC143572696 [Bidens hawaiensis]|uniref:uncharacterized protein LOC143572696 n=1 Tax=Bidens hawaiensis TaxID=980011 RepID=UPI00404A179F
MRNWRFCSTSGTKHFKLHLKICELEGLVIDHVPNKDSYNMQVHVKLEIPRKGHVPRIAVQKDHTYKQCVNPDGRVTWNEDFEQSCSLDINSRSPRSWKIELEVHGIDVESNHKAEILAKVKIDVTEFTTRSEKWVKLPVNCHIGGVTHEAILKVKLDVIEVEKNHTKNTVHPVSPTHLLPSLLSCVNFQIQNQSQTRNKMEMEMEKESCQSESEEETDQSYQRIKTIDLTRSRSMHETIIYQGKEQTSSYEVFEKHKLKRILSWNIRKKPKDAPLLNKANGEGGDDIDNARRTLLSFLKPQKDKVKGDVKDDEFMDSARFEVGKWEKKTVKSRDGKLELQTDIFMATIDQRSEKALGGGACTVIATIITDWLFKNPNALPLKCELDKLIRDGSREWRSLCEEETHKDKFLDQHFDLDTVIQAKIRPLEVVSEKSYVGFFKLENINESDHLQDAMSFDTIWDEIQSGESSSEGVYIVSWNDHFFVLKKEKNEIFIIDTLGERLTEGCDKAYILKFNEGSVIVNVPPELKTSKVEPEKVIKENHEKENSPGFACKGTSCCKEFIKGFLAAIPLGELQNSVEKGINGNAPLHQLLQIEFHYMLPLQQNSPCVEAIN